MCVTSFPRRTERKRIQVFFNVLFIEFKWCHFIWISSPRRTWERECWQIGAVIEISYSLIYSKVVASWTTHVLDEDSRARNDPSMPRSMSNDSASTPDIDGWNHLQKKKNSVEYSQSIQSIDQPDWNSIKHCPSSRRILLVARNILYHTDRPCDFVTATRGTSSSDVHPHSLIQNQPTTQPLSRVVP